MKNTTNLTFGLIGNPLKQSYSPDLHRFFGNYAYDLCQLEFSELKSFFTDAHFKGVNITIPYKEAVIPYLDKLSASARATRAVNTVLNIKGELIGYNTDILGMQALFEQNKITVQQKKILILGTGGTAKTAAVLCRKLNAKKIYFVSRQKSKQSVSYQEAAQIPDIHIIINTTPIGMYDKFIGQSPLSLKPFKTLEAVVDVIYNPLKTDLLLEAEARGIKYCNGLYLLVVQAFYASQLFLKHKLDKQTSRIQAANHAYQQLSAKKSNIVLIGMPSSGKTTIAPLVAKLTNRPFFDTDQLIEKREKQAPADIIKQKGETYFRRLEQAVIADIAYHSGQVIATGGGSILLPQNQKALKANSKIYFLNRRLEDLKPDISRPLTASFKMLEKQYQERYPIYRKLADEIITMDTSAIKTAEKIKEIHYYDNRKSKS